MSSSQVLWPKFSMLCDEGLGNIELGQHCNSNYARSSLVTPELDKWKEILEMQNTIIE
jgi:hypothetical protein